MENAAPPQLSYIAWRNEAARISDLAQQTLKDARLTASLEAVTHPSASQPAAATAAASSSSTVSFLSQLFSSSSSAAAAEAAAVMPWCASLAQLLALAELPPPYSQPDVFTQTGTTAGEGTRNSSTAATQRRFAAVIAAVANSNINARAQNSSSVLNEHGRAGDDTGAGRSLVSSSHAVLPMKNVDAISTASFPRTTAAATLAPSTAVASMQRRLYSHSTGHLAGPQGEGEDDDEDEDDGEGDFDRMFARLKQQAAERSHHQQSRGARTGQAGTPNASFTGSAAAATGGGGGGKPVPPKNAAGPHAGLTAARAALDASELLLLRVRQQNDFSTAPGGRIVEAQTRVLRATICRTAQLYVQNIQDVVDRLLWRHYQAASVEAERQSAHHGHGEGHAAALSYPWARSVGGNSAGALSELLMVHADAAKGRAFDFHHSSAGSYAADTVSVSAAPVGVSVSSGSGGGNSSSAATISPTSAATKSFYNYATTSPSGSGTPLRAKPAMAPASTSATAPNAAVDASHTSSRDGKGLPGHKISAEQLRRYLLSSELLAALHQWKQLAQVQQRSLLCEEVREYVTAGQLFFGAAAERGMFGNYRQEAPPMNSNDGQGGATETLSSTATAGAEVIEDNNADTLVSTPAAELASHGVTHLLRACGLLLSDPMLGQEVPYPAHLLTEMEKMLALSSSISLTTSHGVQGSDGHTSRRSSTTSSSNNSSKAHNTQQEGSAAAAAVLLPPFQATPHASRVWMLLSQTAAFIERHRLQLPWDTTSASTTSYPWNGDSGGVASSSSPPVAHTTASVTTAQMLWEMSAAVLITEPADALRAMEEAVSYTLQKSTSASTPAATAAAGASTASRHVSSSLRELFRAYLRPSNAAAAQKEFHPLPQLVAQPGTLPLCLLSLRNAAAAAVRARHYAEALQSTEVALYLLRTPATFAELKKQGGCNNSSSVQGSEVEESREMKQQQQQQQQQPAHAVRVVDYRRVMDWSSHHAHNVHASLAPPATSTPTASALPSLTHLESRVHFHLMRLFLLLVSTPLTVGDAATQLIKTGVLCRHSSSSSGCVNEDEKEKGKSLQHTEEEKERKKRDDDTAALVMADGQEEVVSDVASDAAQASKSVSPAPSSSTASASSSAHSSPARSRPDENETTKSEGGEEKQNSAAGIEETASLPPPQPRTPVTDVKTTIQQTLCAMQAMAEELRTLEQEALVMPGHREKGSAEHHSASCPSAARVVRFLPPRELRVSSVLQAATDGCSKLHISPSLQDRTEKEALTGTAGVSAGGPMPSGEFSACGTELVAQEPERSPSDLQRDPQEQQQNAFSRRKICTLTSTAKFAELKQRYGRQTVTAAIAETTRPCEKDEGGTAPAVPALPSAAASLHDLHQLLCELLIAVCFLTLPLRARSTSTMTAATDLHLPPHTMGGQREGSHASKGDEEEKAYDVEYMQARRALNVMDGQLERCLYRLGARDRTVFVLLRRLQVELLFPAVCGPLV